MRNSFLLILLSFFISCSTNQDEGTNQKKNQHPSSNREVKAELQQIIDTADVLGSILIYDPQSDKYYSNNFQWADQGCVPASTFKIPNSIIALELDIVENDSTLFKWNGEKRAMKRWEKDLIFKDAFHLSCVPCYQDIARKVGVKRMKEHLKKFDYGNMVVDSSNIDLFWLEGDSKISQFQQIDFLQRFYNSKLPITSRTEGIMKKMIVVDDTASYKLSAKTGWAVRNENNIGWYVGYVETGQKIYYFATNIKPNPTIDIKTFAKKRKKITIKALKKLEII